MIDFAQWLSNSFGTGHLIPDAGITTATVSIVFLTIALMARVSLGSTLEDIAGDNSTGLHESLDQIQIELRTISQLFLYSVERSRVRMLQLRQTAPREPALVAHEL